jgi:hypothetical protein
MAPNNTKNRVFFGKTAENHELDTGLFCTQEKYTSSYEDSVC